MSFFIIFLLLILSCKKENIQESEPKNFHEIFEEFWIQMNYQYVYWDKDPTDWSLVYSKYSPLFDKLTNSDSDIKKSVSYFKQMTKDLIDGHFRITFNTPLLMDSVINPAMLRKSTDRSFHNTYDYSSIVKPYLDENYLDKKGTIVINGLKIRAIYGTINKNILYFRCNFFELKQSYLKEDENEIKPVLSNLFSKLKMEGDQIKGIIIDLRDNFGGSIPDLNFICGKLIPSDADFGFTRNKSGLGKFNYLPWIKCSIAHDSDFNISSPIIVLGNHFTASLAETFIIALKNKTNCLFIGEQTYGATGPISDADIFNSGSFNIGNFMSIETSSVEFKDNHENFYEGIGIKPDLEIPFDYRSLSLGIDKQLEAAIHQINN